MLRACLAAKPSSAERLSRRAQASTCSNHECGYGTLEMGRMGHEEGWCRYPGREGWLSLAARSNARFDRLLRHLASCWLHSTFLSLNLMHPLRIAGLQDAHKTELEAVRDISLAPGAYADSGCRHPGACIAALLLPIHVAISANAGLCSDFPRCRRWCQFEPDTLTISWHQSEGSKALGEFTIDPLLVLAQPSTDNGNANEFKVRATIGEAEMAPGAKPLPVARDFSLTLSASASITLSFYAPVSPGGAQVESKGQIFYAYTEAPEDRTRLLQKIDAARRVKITGDDGAALVRADAAKIAVSGGGRKVFSWGVGSMLGNNNQLAQAWALPQVISALEAPYGAAELCAGPEHAACVSSDGAAQLWGSNEFQQVGVAGPAAIFRPIPLESLGSRKVLSIACGGSHTLAVVADSLDADGGAVVGWGTGTVGQLGLGQTQLLSAEPLVIPLPEIYGNPVPVRKVAAGLVTSAAVLVTGECFVWGDSSLGRLGLPDVPDTLTPAGAPVLVNGKVTWTPRQVDFSSCDLGELSGRKVSVAGLGMGGAFTLFLVTAGDGSGVGAGGGAGGVLLVSGALGVDITKDRYGYPEDVLGPASALDALLETEVKGVARALTPRPVAPFGSRAVVLSVSAGARHAGAVALDTAKGDVPRAYTAGKGWLGQGSDAASLLLPRPTVSQTFAAVGGALASEDGAFARA